MFAPERLTIAAIAVFIVGLTLVGLGEGYPRSAILFPVITAVLVIVFAAVRRWETRLAERELRETTVEGRAAEIAAEAGSLHLRQSVRPFLWVFAALPMLWAFGYLVGLPAYVFVFLLAHRVGALRAALIAAGTALFVYVIFVHVLRALLPAGALFELLGW